jgi:D-alanine-D-alanine ligase
MRVVVFHNAVAADAPKAEQDVLLQAEAVAQASRTLGHEVVFLPCTLDLEAARRDLARLAPDVVFNLVESLGGSDWAAILATGLLDALRLPYTGTPTAPLMLTNDKLLTKELLLQAGLPTPGWIERRAQPALATAAHQPPAFQPQSPYILKTVTEHASFGLDEHSLVRAEEEASLRAELRQMALRLGRDCFAEQFIEGREFNLSVLAGPDGPEVLPPAEIDFSAFPPGKPRIVGARAKWEEGSFEFANTPRKFDFAQGEESLLGQLQELARASWHCFHLRGYVRVDFRVDTAGRPWILELNANPCLSPDAGFAAALERAQISWETAVQRILDDALAVK